jgi:hypothetical protein
MKFGAKRDSLLVQLGFFFAPNFIQNLYTVLKKRLWESRSSPTSGQWKSVTLLPLAMQLVLQVAQIFPQKIPSNRRIKTNSLLQNHMPCHFHGKSFFTRERSSKGLLFTLLFFFFFFFFFLLFLFLFLFLLLLG